MDKKSKIFEIYNPFKAILYLAIPTIISQLIDVIYNLADTFFLGRTENPYMIASTGIATGLFAIGIVFANLFGIGGGSFIARLLGAKQEDRLKNISSFSFYTSIIVAIIYSLVILIFMKPILYAMGASEYTYEYCKQYVSIVVVFDVPIICAANVLAHLLRNTGLSLQAGIGLSLGGLLNIALDPLFMFVLFNEGNEVIAAAIATLLANIVSLIYLIIIYLKTSKKTNYSLRIKDFLNINKEEIKEVLKIGVPSAVLLLLFIFSQTLTLAVMARYGDLQVASIGIVLKVEKIGAAIGIGICQGMLPIVAYNYAAKNEKRMKKTIKSAFAIGITATLICGIINICLSNFIVSIFLNGNNEETMTTIKYGSLFLKIRFLVPAFMFLNYLSSYCLQAINDAIKVFIHAIIRICFIYIPLIFLLSYLYKENGLTIAFEVSELLAGILGITLLYLSLKRRLIKNG